MRLGISYNIFDGEELLEASIKAIRDSVDYVSVIYQLESNFGDKCSPTLEPLLEDLKNKGLIDFIYKYKGKNNPQTNEIEKRNIGLEISRYNKCTHHLSIDCDEFYIKEDFDNAKKLIEDNGYDVTSCDIVNYHKLPTCQVTEKIEPFRVPFIFEIKKSNYFTFRGYYIDLIDPTRMISDYEKPYHFKDNELIMHHMTTIRKDLKKKYSSWTARLNFKSDDIINTRVNEVINYEINMGGEPSEIYGTHPKCIEVENIFNIIL